MNFRRTDFGISNLHLFHGVDAVVFVEGGSTSFTVEQVSAGAYSSQADDLKYWQIVFATFARKKKFHFRAVGSKSTIRELAKLITSGQLKHVLVAMDRDFDHLRGSLPGGPGVLSTIGYSWENDVWTSPVVFATYKKFNIAPQSVGRAKALIDQEFARFSTKLKHCVRADAILSFNKIDPLPRDKFEKIVRPVRGGVPTIALVSAKALMRDRRLQVRPTKLYGPKKKATTLLDCYGHLLENFGFHILVHALKTFCEIRVTPRELLVPAAIDAFAGILPTDPKLKAHYAPLFAAINWS